MKMFIPKTITILAALAMMTACTDSKMRFLNEIDAASSKADAGDGVLLPPVVDPTPVPPVVVDPPPAPTPAPTPVVIATPPIVVQPTPTPVVVVTPAPTPVVIATPAPTPVPPVVIATPAPTPVPPVVQDDCQQAGISQKACYLMKVMELGCPLRDHVPANYVPPTRAEVIANMHRCDAQAYPYTEPTASQLSVIKRLIDPNDASFRKNIFTNLYYKPEYTEDFKKYFGVEVYNAIYTFCDDYGIPPGAGSIMPKEAVNNDRYVMDKDYKAANVYAAQLSQCVYDSMRTK
jgi:hypothetical protein